MCAPGIIEKVEIDTNHFKGNYPDRVTIEGSVIGENNLEKWVQVLPYQKVSFQFKKKNNTIVLFKNNFCFS